jgi:hypothetical protein
VNAVPDKFAQWDAVQAADQFAPIGQNVGEGIVLIQLSAAVSLRYVADLTLRATRSSRSASVHDGGWQVLQDSC